MGEAAGREDVEAWMSPEMQALAASIIETVETQPRHKVQAFVAIEVAAYVAAAVSAAKAEALRGAADEITAGATGDTTGDELAVAVAHWLYVRADAIRAATEATP